MKVLYQVSQPPNQDETLYLTNIKPECSHFWQLLCIRHGKNTYIQKKYILLQWTDKNYDI